MSLLDDLHSEGVAFKHEAHTCSGFHGTWQSSAENIIRKGFDWTFSRDDNAFGHGFYLFGDRPHDGREFAECFARHRKKCPNPAVIKARLEFRTLLDPHHPDNAAAFWQLLKLARKSNKGKSVSDFFVAHLLGTQVADNLGCDGITAPFGLAEPKDGKGRREQIGYCVKKANVFKQIELAKAK